MRWRPYKRLTIMRRYEDVITQLEYFKVAINFSARKSTILFLPILEKILYIVALKRYSMMWGRICSD